MDKKKPVDSVNKNKTLAAKLHQQDWVKKLEAASGKPVQPGGSKRSSASGAANPERCRVQFRCGETGRLFFVFLAKYSTSHAFQIVSVSKEKSTPSSGCQDHSLQNTNPTELLFDASDFDWTGWFCPYCGHRDTLVPFVECGQCKELVCGRRVRQMHDGTQSFACHDGCGATGKIEYHIKSFNVSQEEMSRGFLSSSPRHPSQGKSLPLPKKHLRLSGRKPESS